MEKLEIRDLNVDDVFAVARMLGKITKGAREQLAKALKGKKVDPTELGMVLFQSIFTEAEEDLKAWLSELIGKELADFGKMPATTVLDVIEELIRHEGIKDFFLRASKLATNLPGKD